MKRKSISKVFVAMLCIASVHANADILASPDYGGTALNKRTGKFLPPFVYDLDPSIVIQHVVYQRQ
jgi:hypothetical protein